MAKRFAEHNGLNLTKTNNDVLAEWEKNDIFHKSIDEREGCQQFIFFEGPPSIYKGYFQQIQNHEGISSTP
jgi:isoleucyl-tRNA synthetase